MSFPFLQVFHDELETLFNLLCAGAVGTSGGVMVSKLD